ncbi:PREDICTED: LOB domain-containing protein 36 [Nelumbo nucifera]|uniref:LOB domain-containing protein 36 n=1 Tax=Nelumbo nucifera TaxID=4432 RepID=A0A1U7ZP68_NELNU|nr:PREDICTED: LOB domain-containing protein 36 [Nelumbo nucifera]
MASSSNSPCAACKFLRRKCTQECVFAPYFPPDNPQKFANVHKVFGASNVAKLLNELSTTQREDAVNSLAYEAEARLRDPVYGCVGLISVLQQKLKQVQHDLYNAKKELSNYIGPSAMLPITHQHHHHLLHHHQQHPSPSMGGPFGMSSVGMGMPPGPSAQAQFLIREQQQMIEAQQLAGVMPMRDQHEMMRRFEQQQHDLVRFNSGFDVPAGAGGAGSSNGSGGGGFTDVPSGVGGGGYNQMSAALPSSLALVPFDNPFQVQQPQPEHPQQPHPPHLQQYQQQQQQHRTGSDEGRSVGPSS